MLQLRQSVPLSFSPDGERLLVGSEVTGTQQLYLVPARGGEPEQLTDEPEPVAGRFLADGRVLVAVDEGGNERTQLHVLGAGGLEPLVTDPRYVHRTPQAAGRTLAYATNRRNGVDFDVVARDLGTGEERTWEIGGHLSVVAISPDGRRIVADKTGAASGDNDLYVCDVETGACLLVTSHDEPAEFATPVWLGGGLVLSTNLGRETFAIVRDGAVVYEAPWDVHCTADAGGRSLLVHANEDGYSRLTLLDPTSFAERATVELPDRGVVDEPVFSPDGSLLAFAFSTAVAPREVYLYDLGARTLTQLTSAVRDFEPSRLVEPALHRFGSFDGEEVPVFLFTPRGAGPFPVVVTVHGGPEAQWRPWYSPSFAPLTQYLVERGFAVAAPNVRGSTGYGKRYEHLDDVRLRLDSVRDLAALHDWLVARPEIDASRIAIYGRSYGGYMVLAALAFQPERWAAGVEAVGIASLVTFLENTSEYRRAAREREYGSLARDRDFLVEASPLTRVDAIRAPLFIQHGRNDPRVPVGESEQIHAALAARGVETELLVFDDEGHTVEKPANRLETFTRAVAFLERVLAS